MARPVRRAAARRSGEKHISAGSASNSAERLPPAARRRNLAAIALALLIGLGAFANAYLAGPKGQATAQSFGASCIASANRAIKRAGGDPDAPPIKQRVGTYCGCMLMAMQARYTPAEFAAIAVREEESLARDEKLNAAAKTCARAAGAG